MIFILIVIACGVAACGAMIWLMDEQIEDIEKKLDRLLEKLDCNDKEKS